MVRKLSALLVAAAIVLSSAAQAKFFSFGLDEAQVKDVVKEYLLNNPEIVKEAMDNYNVRQQELERKKQIAKLKTNRRALERDPATPVIGNPDGDITIVEFFDYNCGYCKLMFPKVMEYVENDGNIRWVLKDMPSLGETSHSSALAGLAAAKQGKYFEMHQALITHKGGLTEEDINKYAKEIGLNMKQFEADKKDPEFEKQLRANAALAQKFGFRGIPNFIIGDFISNGAMMNNELDEAVTAIREGTQK